MPECPCGWGDLRIESVSKKWSLEEKDPDFRNLPKRTTSHACRFLASDRLSNLMFQVDIVTWSTKRGFDALMNFGIIDQGAEGALALIDLTQNIVEMSHRRAQAALAIFAVHVF